jgi:virginiamycin A acetyltransferase
MSMIKHIMVQFFRLIAFLIVLLPVFFCKVEEKYFPSSEYVFQFWGDLFSLFPGVPGSIIRCIFYRFTIKHCSPNVQLYHGVSIAHRESWIEDHVIITSYTCIGRCHIGEGTGIGSGCHLISGRREHPINSVGVDFSKPMKGSSINIGNRVWIGDACVIMADIGDGAIIGAGSVVTKPIDAHSVAVGNPARVIRKLTDGSREG